MFHSLITRNASRESYEGDAEVDFHLPSFVITGQQYNNAKVQAFTELGYQQQHKASINLQVVERCTEALNVLLRNMRMKDRVREDGDLQVLASLHIRESFTEATLKNILQVLLSCIEDNEENREFLHKINCHANLTTYSKSNKKVGVLLLRL